MKIVVNVKEDKNLSKYLNPINGSDVTHLVINIFPEKYSYNLKDFSNVTFPKLKKLTINNVNKEKKGNILHHFEYLKCMNLDQIKIFGNKFFVK